MRRILLKIPSFFASDRLHSPLSVRNPIPGPRFVPCGGASTRSGLVFFSSDPESSCEPEKDRASDSGSLKDGDMSTEELKRRVQRFLDKGGAEEVPIIMEAIMKRRLSGKHEESDNEMMEEIGEDYPIDKLSMGNDDDCNDETDDGLKDKKLTEK